MHILASFFGNMIGTTSVFDHVRWVIWIDMGDMGEVAGQQVGGAAFSMFAQAGTPAKRPPFSELRPERPEGVVSSCDFP